MIAPHELMRECPMCGRVVARWTNGGKIPPHGKRTVRHKCPHGTWCQQANPLIGTHSNGRPVMHHDARTGETAGCKTCHAIWLAIEIAERMTNPQESEMSQTKKKIRRDFNAVCMRRDGGKCRMCGIAAGDRYKPDHQLDGTATLTAHHITPRERMPNGGYVESNGITLCESCHIDVESVYANDEGTMYMAPERIDECQPSNLYKLIGSSYAKALADSDKS